MSLLFPPPRCALLASFLLLGLALTGCAPTETQFRVDYAPGYRSPPNGTVSVLGVLREGRMSPDMWDEISPRVSAALGRVTCPVAYDTSFPTTHHDLAEAIDDYARANGITDALLERLAPAAKGDEVLVITMAGRPLDTRPPPDTIVPSTAVASGMPRGRTGGLPPPALMFRGGADPNAFEMTASIFSVREHKSVATLAMGYSGQSGDEALAAFAEKVKTSFPGLSCAAWEIDGKVDAEAIRGVKSE